MSEITEVELDLIAMDNGGLVKIKRLDTDEVVGMANLNIVWDKKHIGPTERLEKGLPIVAKLSFLTKGVV